MENTVNKKVAIVSIVLLMTMNSLPAEAQHTRESYTKKIRSKEYYHSVNQVVPASAVAYNMYSHPQNLHRNYIRPAVVRPSAPVARNVKSISRDAIHFRSSHQDFYYSRGNFYTRTNFGYSIVPVPLGAQIKHLPYGSNRVIFKGNILYQINGVLLEARINRRGRVVYEIVGLV